MHLLIALFITLSCNTTDVKTYPCDNPSSSIKEVSHAPWDALLKKHVTSNGMVDYQGFMKDREALTTYLTSLACVHPDKSWSREEQLAYWINAYNAFTVELVLQHYPLESIKDIGGIVGSPWDVEFIVIKDKTYTLNNIEHDILRKEFEEPRIHFAINCASISCPVLIRDAFLSEKIDQQLEARAKAFINDPKRNKITADNPQISKLFDWFKGDFTKNGTLIDYLNKYSNVKIKKDADIDYLDYDWALNQG